MSGTTMYAAMADGVLQECAEFRNSWGSAAKGQSEPKRYHPPRTQRAASDHDRAKARQALTMLAALAAGGSYGC